MLAVTTDAGEWLRDGKRALRSICPQPVLNWREERFYARYGEVELNVLDYLCERTRDAIDIGANDGCYIHFLRKYARRVHAFEPIPWLVEGLEEKFRHAIARKQVVIQALALSSAAGTSVLRVPVVDGVLVHGCSSVAREALAKYPQAREIPVRTDTLDNVYAGDVGFIKIDVEGHEEAVLDGARATITRCQPRMQVELEESIAPGAIARVAEFFRVLGYRGYFIYQRQVMPIEWFNRSVMQNPANYPDLKAPLEHRGRFGRYIYNFLFLPPAESEDTPRRISERIAGL